MKLFPKPHPQTAGRVIDQEAVLMLADKSEVNVLNHVGARIFQLADGSRTGEEIAGIITSEFDVTPETAYSDVAEFLNELIDQEIFVAATEPEEA